MVSAHIHQWITFSGGELWAFLGCNGQEIIEWFGLKEP